MQLLAKTHSHTRKHSSAYVRRGVYVLLGLGLVIAFRQLATGVVRSILHAPETEYVVTATNDGIHFHDVHVRVGHGSYETEKTVRPTCDGSHFLMTCSKGFVITEINEAFYGRSDNVKCPHPEASAMQNTACSLATVKAETEAVCLGKHSCNPHYSDPCPGTHKWASTTFQCRPEQPGTTV